MRTKITLHPQGHPVLTAKRSEDFQGIIWIEVRDSRTPDEEGVGIFVRDRTFHDVWLAVAAFNEVLKGQAEGYLAPTAPSLPAAE